MTAVIIVKREDKVFRSASNVEVPYPYKFIFDCDAELRYLWQGDPTRPWDKPYSQEQFRKFWDRRTVEHRDPKWKKKGGKY